MPTVPKAIIYCRVSDPKQVTRGSGLGSQETRCRDYARARSYEVVEVFRDEGASGGLIDRPGMLAMLAFLKKHRRADTHVVIIDDISRLARGLEAHIRLRTSISAAGGKLESPSIEFGEDSDSMLVENLLASVSQHQRQKNAEQTKNRMQARVANGYWAFSPPIGYCYDRVSGHTGKVLVPRQPLASIVKEALEGFASGRFETQAEVQRFLQADPLFPKNRHGDVHPERVKIILSQVIYAGYFSVPEWGIYRLPAKHEPLIDFATFLKIEKRLGRGDDVAPNRPDVMEAFPLRGFVNCACCDRPMTAAYARGSKGKRYAYYWCFTKGCELARKNIRKEQLEADFERLLDSVRPTQELLFAAHAMLKLLWEMRETSAKEQASQIARELQGIERKIEQLVARLVETDSRALIDAYETQLHKLQDQKHLLTEKAAFVGRPKKSFEESFRTSFGFLANPRILWDSGRIEHRRTMLRLLFGGRVKYSVSEGLRTPQTTSLFNALRDFGNDNSRMAHPKGFEPLTPRFVVWCSIQLSYGCVPPWAGDAGHHGSALTSRSRRPVQPKKQAVQTGSGPIPDGERVTEPSPRGTRPAGRRICATNATVATPPVPQRARAAARAARVEPQLHTSPAAVYRSAKRHEASRTDNFGQMPTASHVTRHNSHVISHKAHSRWQRAQAIGWQWCSADRVSSGDTPSALLPNAAGVSALPFGDPIWQGTCSQPAWSDRFTPCKPTCVSQIAFARPLMGRQRSSTRWAFWRRSVSRRSTSSTSKALALSPGRHGKPVLKPSFTCLQSAPMRRRARSTPEPKAKVSARFWKSSPAPLSCGRRSCSAVKINSSIASPVSR